MQACSATRGAFTNTRQKVPTIGTQLDYGMSGIHGERKKKNDLEALIKWIGRAEETSGIKVERSEMREI